MSNRFASAKHSIAECDRCGPRYKLKQLNFIENEQQEDTTSLGVVGEGTEEG